MLCPVLFKSLREGWVGLGRQTTEEGFLMFYHDKVAICYQNNQFLCQGSSVVILFQSSPFKMETAPCPFPSICGMIM